MDKNKQDELLSDIKDGESNCCGASMVGDICLDCKEHCEDISLEDAEYDKEQKIRADTEDLDRDNYYDR